LRLFARGYHADAVQNHSLPEFEAEGTSFMRGFSASASPPARVPLPIRRRATTGPPPLG
jgi:hypothetical protein